MLNPTVFTQKLLIRLPSYWVIGLGFVLSLSLSVALHQLLTRQTLEIELWMSQSALSPAHIYYASAKQAFDQNKVVALGKEKPHSLENQPYFVKILAPQVPNRLRFDLAQEPGEIRLRGLKLRTSYGETYFSALDIKKHAYGLNDGFWIDDRETVAFLSTGDDPFFILAIPTLELGKKGIDTISEFLVSMSIYGGILFGVFLLWFASWKNEFRMALRIGAVLDSIGERVSDPGVLEIRRVSVFVFIFLFLVFVLYLYFQLHNSSLWQWSAYYPVALPDLAVFLGQAQAIRSDEWYGHTPWLLSQAQHGFPIYNPSIGPKGTPLLTALPVEGLAMILQPKFWGFLFLDMVPGFSWYWATRLVLFFGSTYLLFLIVLRGDEKLSVIATIWLFGSSYTQWWYAFASDIITSCALVAVGMLLIVRSSRKIAGAAGVLMFVFGGLGFLFTLYPPYVISLSYFLLIVILPSVLWMIRTQQQEARLGYRATLFGLGVGTVLVVAVPILIAAWPAIVAISNTDYPGARFALGGDYPLSLLGMGLFEFWRDETSTPTAFHNPSEAAGFALFFPLAALVLFVKCRDSLLRTQLIWITLFAGFLIIWMAAPLPTSVRQVIAYTGWFAVPGARAYIAAGMSSILVTVLAVKLVKESGHVGWRGTLLSGSFVTLLIGFLWWRYWLIDPAFFSVERLLVAVLVAILMVLAVSRGSVAALGFAVMLLVFRPLQVNPVHTGLDPLLANPIFKEMLELDQHVERKKWLVFGNGRAAQAMKANGMEVFGGIIYAPDRTLMGVLDPGGEFRSVWNRYANVALRPGRAGDPTKFELVHGDHYVIEIDPCDPRLSEMGFTRAVFEGDLATSEFGCFGEYYRDEFTGLAFGTLGRGGNPGSH